MLGRMGKRTHGFRTEKPKMKTTVIIGAALLFTLAAIQHVEATTNYAVRLASSTDYVLVPDSNSLDLVSNFTLEAWVNPSRIVNQEQAVISKPRRSDGTGIELRTFGKGLGVGFNNDPGNGTGINLVFGGGQTLELNTWHHIAATYDGTVAYVYIDGVSVGTNKFSAKLLNSSAPLTIGQKNPPGGPLVGSFLGLIDEVRVWNRALTQTEIQTDMSLRLTGQEPGLVGYWNFSMTRPGRTEAFITMMALWSAARSSSKIRLFCFKFSEPSRFFPFPAPHRQPISFNSKPTRRLQRGSTSTSRLSAVRRCSLSTQPAIQGKRFTACFGFADTVANLSSTRKAKSAKIVSRLEQFHFGSVAWLDYSAGFPNPHLLGEPATGPLFYHQAVVRSEPKRSQWFTARFRK